MLRCLRCFELVVCLIWIVVVCGVSLRKVCCLFVVIACWIGCLAIDIV